MNESRNTFENYMKLRQDYTDHIRNLGLNTKSPDFKNKVKQAVSNKKNANENIINANAFAEQIAGNLLAFANSQKKANTHAIPITTQSDTRQTRRAIDSILRSHGKKVKKRTSTSAKKPRTVARKPVLAHNNRSNNNNGYNTNASSASKSNSKHVSGVQQE